MSNPIRRHLVTYAICALAVGLTLFVQWLLNQFLEHRLPFVTTFAAVAFAVWFAGWRPALFAAALGYLGSYWLIIGPEPHSPLAWTGSGGAVGLIAFGASCAIIIGFGSGMRVARKRAEAAAKAALAHQLELEREVEERKRAQLALAEADRRKDVFLAALGHELRNPLMPIRSAVEIMRLARSDEKTVEQAREIIERQTDHLTRIVDDLLDLTRIANGKLDLRRSWIELRPVLQHAIETSRPAIDAAGHTLDVALPPEPIYVDADLTRLVQAFANLLINACRYTPAGGHIWLTGALEGNDAVVAIRDDGIGIPAERLHEIFQIFAQLDSELERSYGGLGVGLALVQRLVEMHGGTIDAFSAGSGCGSEFVVRLPATAVPPAPRSTCTS
jgi:signal transduction histidine kinase